MPAKTLARTGYAGAKTKSALATTLSAQEGMRRRIQNASSLRRRKGFDIAETQQRLQRSCAPSEYGRRASVNKPSRNNNDTQSQFASQPHLVTTSDSKHDSKRFQSEKSWGGRAPESQLGSVDTVER